MKNNSDYNVVKDKIGSLTTLSGGIVFAKEEGWDRLQGRLEKKPVKIMSLRFVAAAAILLIFVCIMSVSYFDQKNLAIRANYKAAKQKVDLPKGAQTLYPSTVPETEITGNNDAVTRIETQGVSFFRKKQRKIQQPVITTIQPPSVPAPENKANDNPAPVSGPTAIVKKEMAVIHINDLENGTFRREMPSVVATTKPAVDLNNIRVVHINDVEKEDKEVKQILRENRMTSGHYPFLKPASNYIDLDEYRQSRKSLKNILTPQN